MKKVLIIDDEPSIAEIVNLFCMQIGYSADAVHSGRSAMEKIRNNRYWAVFCDLQMPGLNGMEIYDKVKEVNADLSGKFVLLTGAMLDQEMEITVAEQKIKVLQKPFHFDGIRKLFSELEV